MWTPGGDFLVTWSHLQESVGHCKVLHVAKVLSSYMLNGLTFSTFTWHRGNSLILVRCPSLPSNPAWIESILQTPSNGIFFVTWYFLRLMCDNPFKKYPVLQSSLWSQDLGQLVIVKPHLTLHVWHLNGMALTLLPLYPYLRYFLIFMFVQINIYLFCRNANYCGSCTCQGFCQQITATWILAHVYISCSLICAEIFYLSLIITNFIIVSNKLMKVNVKAGSGGMEVRSLFKGLCIRLSTEVASPPLYPSFSSLFLANSIAWYNTHVHITWLCWLTHINTPHQLS